ncbi:MAG: Ig-like domain-containing protein, partial [Bacteroidota bacterium]
MKQILLLLICFGFYASTIYAQDQCTVVGWATENDGVTGGENATPVVVTNHSELVQAIDNEVSVIHISGTITFPDNGRITIQDVSGLTIFGLPGAKLVSTDLTSGGSGIFYIKRVTNLIIQNITFEGPGAYDEDGYDNLCLDNCQNVWVDHCDFQDGMDGNFDIKNMSDYVSVTWCIFQYKKDPIAGGSGGSDDHRYTNLIGSSASAIEDRNHLNTTFQFCWWGEGCRERMPRVRFGKIHMLNNYFSSAVSSYCARAGEEANILLEGNYFDDQNGPVDLFKSNAIVAESNNVSTRGSISTQNAGSVFSPPYSYVVADPNTIITPITTCAGATLPSFGGCSPCAGGDINIPPSVSLTSPEHGSVFSPGETITLTASASDSDGSVADVKFYDGTTLIGISTAGYSVSWSGATEG